MIQVFLLIHTVAFNYPNIARELTRKHLHPNPDLTSYLSSNSNPTLDSTRALSYRRSSLYMLRTIKVYFTKLLNIICLIECSRSTSQNIPSKPLHSNRNPPPHSLNLNVALIGGLRDALLDCISAFLDAEAFQDAMAKASHDRDLH